MGLMYAQNSIRCVDTPGGGGGGGGEYKKRARQAARERDGQHHTIRGLLLVKQLPSTTCWWLGVCGEASRAAQMEQRRAAAR